MTQPTSWPTSRITQAVTNPGSVVGHLRGPGHATDSPDYQPHQETWAQWATRAVLHVLDQWSREGGRHIDVITTNGVTVERAANIVPDRAVQLRDEMVQRWIRLPVVGEVPVEQPVIFRDIAKTWPPGTEPPPALVDEFPSELPR